MASKDYSPKEIESANRLILGEDYEDMDLDEAFRKALSQLLTNEGLSVIPVLIDLGAQGQADATQIMQGAYQLQPRMPNLYEAVKCWLLRDTVYSRTRPPSPPQIQDFQSCLKQFLSKAQDRQNERAATPLRLAIYPETQPEKYSRIVAQDEIHGNTVFCFVQKDNGDIFAFKSWGQPRSRVCGNIYAKDHGDSAINEHGRVEAEILKLKRQPLKSTSRNKPY